jgi:diazepam-binding inhibitor (GABA receptor modulator, acyl-CoA-binding protein)
MGIKEDFAKAQKDIKTLDSLDNDHLLQLYSLYKQATQGDVSGKRPGMLDMVGRAKFDAWSKVKGTGSEEAMKKYIALVKKLLA